MPLRSAVILVAILAYLNRSPSFCAVSYRWRESGREFQQDRLRSETRTTRIWITEARSRRGRFSSTCR